MVLMLLWVWAWAIVGISSMNGHVPYVSSTKCLYIFVRHMTMQNRRSILWNCLRVCGNPTTAIHLAHQHKKHAHTLFTIHFTLSFFHSKFSLCFFFVHPMPVVLANTLLFFFYIEQCRPVQTPSPPPTTRAAQFSPFAKWTIGRLKVSLANFQSVSMGVGQIGPFSSQFFFPLDKSGLRFECEWRTFGLRSIRMLSVRFSSLPSLYSAAIGSLGCLLFNCDFY